MRLHNTDVVSCKVLNHYISNNIVAANKEIQEEPQVVASHKIRNLRLANLMLIAQLL